MNSKPPTQTTTSEQESVRGPLPAQRPYWMDIWNQTGQALDAKSPNHFVAQANPWQMQSVNQLYNLAPSLGQNAGALQEMAGKVASGYFLDPNNDPTFRGAANAAITPVRDQLLGSVLPQLEDRSMKLGGIGGGPAAYGGARQDIQQNQAVSDFERNALNTTSSMANASRNMGMQLIPQASAIAQGANTISLAPSTAIGLAGAQKQGFTQAQYDDAIKKYLFGFQGPQLAANIMATGGFGKSNTDSTSTTMSQAPSLATQWLQGLTGGAAGLSSLFGAQGAFPGVGTSIAQFLPFLSDRRFKEDIEQVGVSFSGKPIYVYKYKGLPGYMLGFMADELPSEVVHEVEGTQYVDYFAATREDVNHGRA